MFPNEPIPVLQPSGGDLSCDRKQSLESKELLNRREASEYASLIGTSVAVATYAKLASVGGGPPRKASNESKRLVPSAFATGSCIATAS